MLITWKIPIKKQEKRFLLFLFYYTLVIQGLMSLLGLPQGMLYIKDIILVLCVALDLYRRGFNIEKTDLLQLLTFALFIISIVSALIGNVPFFTYLVAMRKFFRGFVYMALCIEYLNAKDADRTIQNCYKIQCINFILVTIQRFALGLDQDHSNGIFGTELTNNYTSVLCIILVCYCTVEFYYKRCTLKKWIFQLVLNFGIAAIDELKVLFILLPLSIVFILRKKLFSLRGIKLILVLILGLACALILFGTMYQDQLSAILTISGMKNYNDWGLATHAIVDRKNWLQYTVENVFNGNIIEYLIGVGFGTISGLPSSSIDAYGYRILGYGSYTASTLFLELGFSGLILVAVWFCINLRRAYKNSKDVMEEMLTDFEKGFVLSMLVFLVYANILFNDSSYMVFFTFSFLYMKNRVGGKESGKSRYCNRKL